MRRAGQPVGGGDNPQRAERVDVPAVRDLEHDERVPRVREDQPLRCGRRARSQRHTTQDGQQIAADERQLHRPRRVVDARPPAGRRAARRADRACARAGSASAPIPRVCVAAQGRVRRHHRERVVAHAAGRGRPTGTAPCRCRSRPAKAPAAPGTGRRTAAPGRSARRSRASSCHTRASIRRRRR